MTGTGVKFPLLYHLTLGDTESSASLTTLIPRKEQSPYIHMTEI